MLKNNVIAYKVNKEIMTNMYISVQNGEVVVNAPWYLTHNQIQKIVQEKREWILNKIKEYEKNKKTVFINEQEIYILGKNYKVQVKYKNIKIPELNLEKEIINIILPSKYKKINKEQIINILISNMYEKIAKIEIETIMEKVRITLGFAPEDYEIKRMKKELGKCLENREIIINPDIVKYNKKIIEYIIIHQFCHLKYKTHSKKFMELIEKYVPHYKEYDKKLSEYSF